MEIKTECPWCKQHYSVDESFVGQNVECSVCGKQFEVRTPIISTPSSNSSSVIGENTFVPKGNNRKRFLVFASAAFVIVLILLFVFYLYQGKSISEKEYQKGYKAYNEHRYTEAVEHLQKAAKNGYSEAQVLLGLCYANGDGISRNVDEAVQWFRKAAEQNNLQAQFRLGLCYLVGIGVNPREEEALYWLQKAAEQVNHEAQVSLGDFYYNKGKTLENFSESLKWYQKSEETGKIADETKTKKSMCITFQNAYNGDVDSQLAVFAAYEGELSGIKKDEKEARKWLVLAANSGNPKAQGILGDVLMRSGKEEEALEWLKKAGNQGDANAIKILANYYLEESKRESSRGNAVSAAALRMVAKSWLELLQEGVMDSEK